MNSVLTRETCLRCVGAKKQLICSPRGPELVTPLLLQTPALKSKSSSLDLRRQQQLSPTWKMIQTGTQLSSTTEKALCQKTTSTCGHMPGSPGGFLEALRKVDSDTESVEPSSSERVRALLGSFPCPSVMGTTFSILRCCRIAAASTTCGTRASPPSTSWWTFTIATALLRRGRSF
ncbi:GRB2 related adaptor protein a isoform X2 [Nothobranchius furzeri]|uniref:GRB2 related adaptor protein a isoform X2 n=1 Tax=Nothobranchius furzeri TaxID=105023 RepID=UPI003904A211